MLASLFDPLGHLQLLIIQLKTLFQELCRLKLKWDDVIPDDLKQEWENALKSLSKTPKIEIVINFPQYEKDDPIIVTELHGFSDASLKAYGLQNMFEI